MRKSTFRILLAGLTVSAGTLMVAGPAAAAPGPVFDDHPQLELPIPCWQLPGGCDPFPFPVDPVDPPADPPADPQPEPEQPQQPVDPGTPGDPGTGGATGPSGSDQSTGAGETVEPSASTDAVPVLDQAAADEESSDSSPMLFVALGVVGAALAALAIVAVLRLRSRALSH